MPCLHPKGVDAMKGFPLRPRKYISSLPGFQELVSAPAQGKSAAWEGVRALTCLPSSPLLQELAGIIGASKVVFAACSLLGRSAKAFMKP